MSETPRTDAASRMAFSGEYMVPIQEAQKLERELTQSKEANAGLMRACEQLERQLADMTKQRDALAEALREIASGAYCWKTCVDVIAPKALETTKGGIDE